MLRSALLYLSDKKDIQKWIMGNSFSRKSALRFVAGETRRDAIDAVRELNRNGIDASLDCLGESVTEEREARRACDEYLALLEEIRASGVRAHVSVKLTALGLDVREKLAGEHLDKICTLAKEVGTFVRVDMEASKYTETTVQMYRQALEKFDNVGLAVQAYLYRTEADCDMLLEKGGKFRLCKGAYKEPAEVAFQDKADVDRNYVKLMKKLLTSGIYHGLATHDEAIIREAIAFAREKQIPAKAFEFQMLYGIRRDLQAELARDWRMRVYVPYGTNWYPYLMRRLAERPANLWFVVSNLFR